MKKESRIAVFCKTSASIIVGIYRGNDLINVIISKSIDEILQDSRFFEVKYIEENETGREVSKLLGLSLLRKGLGREICLLASVVSLYERMDDD